MTEKVPPKVLQQMILRIPLARMGEPQDIASAVAFLASDASKYMTGNVLEVAGGMAM